MQAIRPSSPTFSGLSLSGWISLGSLLRGAFDMLADWHPGAARRFAISAALIALFAAAFALRWALAVH